MKEKLHLLLRDNPISVVFDLSYTERQLHPECYPMHIASWKQREHMKNQPPRYRYKLFDLSNNSSEHAPYFMWVYCDILRREIDTVEELSQFFTWMSKSIMDGYLADIRSTTMLWTETLLLTYKRPNTSFTPKLRDSHKEFLCDYLLTTGNEVRRATLKQFAVLPI